MYRLACTTSKLFRGCNLPNAPNIIYIDATVNMRRYPLFRRGTQSYLHTVHTFIYQHGTYNSVKEDDKNRK